MNENLYIQFERWINQATADTPPPDIIAFNLNLYDSPFRADLIGARSFDANDPDWACDESWAPPERFFDFPEDLMDKTWEGRLELCRELLMRVIHGDSETAHIFRQSKAVAIGFADGDLEIVHGCTE